MLRIHLREEKLVFSSVLLCDIVHWGLVVKNYNNLPILWFLWVSSEYDIVGMLTPAQMFPETEIKITSLLPSASAGGLWAGVGWVQQCYVGGRS